MLIPRLAGIDQEHQALRVHRVRCKRIRDADPPGEMCGDIGGTAHTITRFEPYWQLVLSQQLQAKVPQYGAFAGA